MAASTAVARVGLRINAPSTDAKGIARVRAFALAVDTLRSGGTTREAIAAIPLVIRRINALVVTGPRKIVRTLASPADTTRARLTCMVARTAMTRIIGRIYALVVAYRLTAWAITVTSITGRSRGTCMAAAAAVVDIRIEIDALVIAERCSVTATAAAIYAALARSTAMTARSAVPWVRIEVDAPAFATLLTPKAAGPAGSAILLVVLKVKTFVGRAVAVVVYEVTLLGYGVVVGNAHRVAIPTFNLPLTTAPALTGETVFAGRNVILVSVAIVILPRVFAGFFARKNLTRAESPEPPTHAGLFAISTRTHFGCSGRSGITLLGIARLAGATFVDLAVAVVVYCRKLVALFRGTRSNLTGTPLG